MNCPPPGYGSSIGASSPIATPTSSIEDMKRWTRKFPKDTLTSNLAIKLLAEAINFGLKKGMDFDRSVTSASELSNSLREDTEELITFSNPLYQKIIKSGQLIFIEAASKEAVDVQDDIYWNEFKRDIDPRNYKAPDSPWSFLGGLKYAAYFGAAILAIYAATDVVNAAAAFRHGTKEK